MIDYDCILLDLLLDVSLSIRQRIGNLETTCEVSWREALNVNTSIDRPEIDSSGIVCWGMGLSRCTLLAFLPRHSMVGLSAAMSWLVASFQASKWNGSLASRRIWTVRVKILRWVNKNVDTTRSMFIHVSTMSKICDAQRVFSESTVSPPKKSGKTSKCLVNCVYILLVPWIWSLQKFLKSDVIWDQSPSKSKQ